MTTIVYTDGACSGNPGPGGWAWVVPDGPYEAGHAPRSTNQRMEITAAARAVGALAGPLEVRSDSTYVVNCFRDGWWKGWEARGWLSSQRKPVANRDLWEPLVEAVKARGDVRFTWVKGHSGDRWNDVADRLAVAALRQQVDLRGERPPDQLGPPDTFGGAPAGAEARDDAAGGAAVEPVRTVEVPRRDGERELPGHPLVVLGHHPPALAGLEDDVRRRLAAHLARRSGEVDELVVVTGLRRGSEQLGAEAAGDAGVPYMAVLPFPDADRDWSEPERERFAALLGGAREVRVLESTVPATAQGATASVARRDRWLARNSCEAVLIWDGRDPRLARVHAVLVDELGDEVLPLDPAGGGGRREARPSRRSGRRSRGDRRDGAQ